VKLARHHVGEEIFVYPFMQKKLDNGNELVSKDREDHQEIAESLYKLQSKKTSDPEYPAIFKEVMDELRDHIKREEEVDIPELEAILSREESENLAKQFAMTKNFAPTRSHPLASSFQPPFETALALLTAPIDKVRLPLSFKLISSLWMSSDHSQKMSNNLRCQLLIRKCLAININ
jgi:Hemerythrin HHE cation binding domain